MIILEETLRVLAELLIALKNRFSVLLIHFSGIDLIDGCWKQVVVFECMFFLIFPSEDEIDPFVEVLGRILAF